MSPVFNDAQDKQLLAKLKTLSQQQLLLLIAFSLTYRRHDLIALVDKVAA